MKTQRIAMATICTLCLFGSALDVLADTHTSECLGGKGHDPATEISKERATAAQGDVGILAVSKPSVVTRTQWGCPDGQSSPQWSWQYTTVSHLIVHHSATPNSDTDWEARVRQIFYYHRDDNGWGDIGYNYLIDPNGIIYEGRAGGDNVIGAHFSCMNGGTMGVCLLGSFGSAQPTQAALNSLQQLLAWKCDQRSIDPLGSAYHSNSQLTLARICGHSDGNSSPVGCPSGTTCPGAQLYAKLPNIRTAVNDLINGGGGSPVLNYDSNVIHDGTGGGIGNSDGLINPGEEIDLDVYLRNTGDDTATTVSASLSTTSPYVTITDSSENWPDIGSGSTEPCNADFDFDVSSSAPAGHVMNFTLSITADQGTWTRSFTLNVMGGGGGDTTDPVISNYAVSPTSITPGESFVLSFTASDSGGSGLDFAQVWWTTDDGGTPDNSNWAQYGSDQTLASYGDGPVNVEYTITPPSGAYWFGLHLNDQAGNFTTETESGSSPKKITVSSSAPVLAYYSHRIDDDMTTSNGNNDGQVNPGETIELPVTLENTGDADANNVEAILSTSDSYITITDNDRGWGDIPAGTTDESSDFDFEVSPSCPPGHVISFSLSITSDEGSWTDSFTVQVYGLPPILSYYSHRIDDDMTTSNGNDDGQVNPGEVIELPVTLENTGDADANNVEAILSTSDSYITITDNDRGWGDIPAGTTDESSDFDFEVSPSCPAGHVISFSLSITSDEGSWTDSFTVQVYGLPTAPILEFSSAVPHDGDGGGRGNNNGSIDAGEEIDLDVYLENVGTSEATGVSATLTTADPYVVLHDDSENWPSIGAGATEVCNADFDFSVLDICPAGRNLNFTLNVVSDQDSWTIPLSVQVSGTLPDVPLEIMSWSIAPGVLTIEFTSKVEKTYIIKTSTDLKDWQDLTTLNNGGRSVSTSVEVNGGGIGTQQRWFIRMLETED